MADQPEGLNRLRELLGTVRLRFWCCPVDEHANRSSDSGGPMLTVEWVDGVAHRTAPGCGLTSENVRVARCDNVIEQAAWTATPCDGVLRVKPSDVQARCLSCGA